MYPPYVPDHFLSAWGTAGHCTKVHCHERVVFQVNPPFFVRFFCTNKGPDQSVLSGSYLCLALWGEVCSDPPLSHSRNYGGFSFAGLLLPPFFFFFSWSALRPPVLDVFFSPSFFPSFLLLFLGALIDSILGVFFFFFKFVCTFNVSLFLYFFPFRAF